MQTSASLDLCSVTAVLHVGQKAKTELQLQSDCFFFLVMEMSSVCGKILEPSPKYIPTLPKTVDLFVFRKSSPDYACVF